MAFNKRRLKQFLLVGALALPVVFIGSKIYANVRTQQDDVDPEPQFVGGKPALQKYIDANLKYPAKAKKARTEGVVYISFTVMETGEVTNAKVVRSIGNGCDEEALRIVEEMPNWVPGKEDGKVKALPVVIPIYFKL